MAQTRLVKFDGAADNLPHIGAVEPRLNKEGTIQPCASQRGVLEIAL
jgi:hypothetical protein